MYSVPWTRLGRESAMLARELAADRQSEEVNTLDNPFSREEGQSWRYSEDDHYGRQQAPVDLHEYDQESQDRKSTVNQAMVCCCLGCPFLFAMALGWSFSCWLVSLPGIAWMCVPLCLWAAWDIHKLFLYWDGRVQLVEEWPALKLVRTSVIALVFAVTLCMNLFVAVVGIWGVHAWSESDGCPF